jgi:DNA-binding IclR family transcriptional regulator
VEVEPEGVDDASQVLKSVRSAADSLLALARHRSLGVRELSRELGVSKSTMHRILVSLEPSNLVAFDERSKTYSLGAGVLSLSASYRDSQPFLRKVGEAMTRLQNDLRETIELVTIRDDLRTVIRSEEPSSGLRFSNAEGSQSPLWVGASSRVLLAQWSDERVADYLANVTIDRLTGNTETDPARVRAAVVRARERGWDVSLGESDDAIAGLAVALPGTELGCLALAVHGSISRFTPDAVERFRTALQAAATELLTFRTASIDERR